MSRIADQPMAEGPRIGVPAVQPPDPLRYCAYATIALLAWALTAPVAVAWFAGLGLWGYTRAWRRGLRRSRCWLRDVRLVLAYLGLAFLGAIVFIAVRLTPLG